MLAAAPKLLDGALDIERVVAAIAACADGLDPVAQVGQDVRRQRQHVTVGGLVIGQATVVELFAGPGSLAKVGQADHARTALEGMEGTANGGHLAQIVGAGHQRGQRVLGIAGHLARFLEEDPAHLVVVFEAGLAGRRRFAGQQGQPS